MAMKVEEVKPCRKCAVQIPVEAKVCPYCRRSQSSPVKVLVFGLVLAVVASLAGIWAVTRENPAVFLRKNLEKVRSKAQDKIHPGVDVARKKVKVGMTIDEVRSLLGEPYQINRAVSGDQVTEQWVFKKGDGYQYLYFDNDVLKTIETR